MLTFPMTIFIRLFCSLTFHGNDNRTKIVFMQCDLSFVTFNPYNFSIGHPFLGDYVRLRQNPQWKKICSETNDQYVVFADIINKITRSGGKV